MKEALAVLDADSEVEGKFKSLAGPMLGEAGAEKLLEHTWKLESASSVSELMRLAKVPA